MCGINISSRAFLALSVQLSLPISFPSWFSVQKKILLHQHLCSIYFFFTLIQRHIWIYYFS